MLTKDMYYKNDTISEWATATGSLRPMSSGSAVFGSQGHSGRGGAGGRDEFQDHCAPAAQWDDQLGSRGEEAHGWFGVILWAASMGTVF